MVHLAICFNKARERGGGGDGKKGVKQRDGGREIEAGRGRGEKKDGGRTREKGKKEKEVERERREDNMYISSQ